MELCKVGKVRGVSSSFLFFSVAKQAKKAQVRASMKLCTTVPICCTVCFAVTRRLGARSRRSQIPLLSGHDALYTRHKFNHSTRRRSKERLDFPGGCLVTSSWRTL